MSNVALAMILGMVLGVAAMLPLRIRAKKLSDAQSLWRFVAERRLTVIMYPDPLEKSEIQVLIIDGRGGVGAGHAREPEDAFDMARLQLDGKWRLPHGFSKGRETRPS